MEDVEVGVDGGRVAKSNRTKHTGRGAYYDRRSPRYTQRYANRFIPFHYIRADTQSPTGRIARC